MFDLVKVVVIIVPGDKLSPDERRVIITVGEVFGLFHILSLYNNSQFSSVCMSVY